MKYHIYEGTEQCMDEGDRFESLKEAKERAIINSEQAAFMGLKGYLAHVIKDKTGEFVFTAGNRD